MLALREPESDVNPSWVRLYAADPKPRSCVWRNHAGSFVPNDSAIFSLETSRSSVDGGSTLVRGDLDVLFSTTICDSGRGLAPADPREVGRCCHERVLDLEGSIDVLGVLVGEVVVCDGGCGRFRGASERFSLKDLSFEVLEMSFEDTSLNEGLGGSNITGDLVSSSGIVLSTMDLTEVGVPMFDDESLVGEIDLARSARRACLSFRPCRISSSSLLVRSSSSRSLRSPSSRIRSKKSLTSSDPSFVAITSENRPKVW